MVLESKEEQPWILFHPQTSSLHCYVFATHPSVFLFWTHQLPSFSSFLSNFLCFLISAKLVLFSHQSQNPILEPYFSFCMCPFGNAHYLNLASLLRLICDPWENPVAGFLVSQQTVSLWTLQQSWIQLCFSSHQLEPGKAIHLLVLHLVVDLPFVPYLTPKRKKRRRKKQLSDKFDFDDFFPFFYP